MNTINTVKIKNYRSCLDTSLTFTTPLTALIGVNGVGKTNILSAIYALKSIESTDSDFQKLQKIYEDKPTTVICGVTLNDEKLLIKAEFYLNFDEYHENVKHAQLSYKRPDSNDWLSIEKSYFDYAKYYFDQSDLRLDNRLRRQLFENEAQDFELKYEIIKFLDDITYFSATKFVNPSMAPTSLELKGSKLRRTYSPRYPAGHESFLADLYRAKNEGKPFQRFLRIVGPDGIGLVEDVTFATTETSSSIPTVLANGTVQYQETLNTIIVPSVTIDGAKRPFNQLSEGTFKSLALVFYILNSNKQVLLIEEPEVSVHYGLLSSLVELIKGETDDKQIIISTHSDYVLDKLFPENLIIVTKDRRKGTIAKPLDEAMSANDYAYLKKYLHETGNLGEYWRESGFLNE